MSFTERDATAEDRAVIAVWNERLKQLGHLYRYISLQKAETH